MVLIALIGLCWFFAPFGMIVFSKETKKWTNWMPVFYWPFIAVYMLLVYLHLSLSFSDSDVAANYRAGYVLMYVFADILPWFICLSLIFIVVFLLVCAFYHKERLKMLFCTLLLWEALLCNLYPITIYLQKSYALNEERLWIAQERTN